jgi:sporulation protein YlmC with PRC-barrel domain
MQANAIKGRAVLNLSNAEKVGHVDEVLFDPQFQRVLGFRLKQGRGPAEVLPRDRVRAIGPDAITITDVTALMTADRYAQLVSAATAAELRGTRVVTDGGELLGTIGDLDVDDDFTHVTGYTLSVPLLDRLRHREREIPASAVQRLNIGDIMTVPDDVARQLNPPVL